LFAIGHTPQTQLDVLEALKEGVETGRITQERIDESLMRIIRTKVKLEKIPGFP
jgi:beta-glucosidase-like glycosyl hydrolase